MSCWSRLSRQLSYRQPSIDIDSHSLDGTFSEERLAASPMIRFLIKCSVKHRIQREVLWWDSRSDFDFFGSYDYSETTRDVDGAERDKTRVLQAARRHSLRTTTVLWVLHEPMAIFKRNFHLYRSCSRLEAKSSQSLRFIVSRFQSRNTHTHDRRTRSKQLANVRRTELPHMSSSNFLSTQSLIKSNKAKRNVLSVELSFLFLSRWCWWREEKNCDLRRGEEWKSWVRQRKGERKSRKLLTQNKIVKIQKAEKKSTK